jgi:hypothetical protein
MSTPESQNEAAGDVPLTGRRRTVWPNLVWGIPLIALLIVGYLGVRALFNRGEVVTVTFSRAAGAKAGMTKVLYQGIEAGQLIKRAGGWTFSCGWCRRRKAVSTPTLVSGSSEPIRTFRT